MKQVQIFPFVLALLLVTPVAGAQALCGHSTSKSQGCCPALNREDVSEVRLAPKDDDDASKGYLSLILAVEGGGGWDFANQPNAFAGVKVGGPFSVDLQYDRIQGHSGFSAGGSGVVPLFRFPRFQPFSPRKFVKVFGEPGFGYRAGGGAFGPYGSAKLMAVLLTDTWSDNWLAPYVEFQRRFPVDLPLQGDNRIAFGLMIALCEHCGFN